jgi:hypothetical protein
MKLSSWILVIMGWIAILCIFAVFSDPLLVSLVAFYLTVPSSHQHLIQAVYLGVMLTILLVEGCAAVVIGLVIYRLTKFNKKECLVRILLGAALLLPISLFVPALTYPFSEPLVAFWREKYAQVVESFIDQLLRSFSR